MRGLIKAFTVLTSMVTMTVLVLMVFAYLTIPNEIYATQDNISKAGIIYSFERKDNDNIGHTENQNHDIDSDEEYQLDIKLLKAIPVKSSKVTVTQRRYVTVSGEVFGIKLYTDGVLVVDVREVLGENGNINPAKQAGIKTGDIITSVNDSKVTRNSEVAELIEKSNGEKVKIIVYRNGEEISLSLQPVLSAADSRYKVGLWIRDSTAGIGTMTYYDANTGVFAGLGHAICDVDTQEIMPLLNGEAVDASVNGCYKGEKGVTGELCGVLNEKKIGVLSLNGDTGLYGILNNTDTTKKQTPVALKSEVTTGYAQVVATIDAGEPQYYDAEIMKVSINSEEKSMVVKITDKRLIEKTGGIVQGMSGSPIIQNGMLAGAVTHVFVNDPLQGYAIFAENMLNTSDNVERTKEKTAA